RGYQLRVRLTEFTRRARNATAGLDVARCRRPIAGHLQSGVVSSEYQTAYPGCYCSPIDVLSGTSWALYRRLSPTLPCHFVRAFARYMNQRNECNCFLLEHGDKVKSTLDRCASSSLKLAWDARLEARLEPFRQARLHIG